MYQVDKKKVGEYISKLIEMNYPSARQFCIACLETNGSKEPTYAEIQNQANRLTSIKQGKYDVQVHDLPIFSTLLGVSERKILSGGEYDDTGKTGYGIAQSHDKKEWADYIETEKCSEPIFNTDEFGKTVLDYAVEFHNYDFLKFLWDKNYIWFSQGSDSLGKIVYGIGTDIGGKTLANAQLRFDIVNMAAERGDLKMLKTLKVKEIPNLYYTAHFISCTFPDFNAYYNKNMIEHLAVSDDNVLDWLTDPFEIPDRIKYKDGSKRTHTFMFPYISELLDMLIANNSSFLKQALQKCIAYNEEILKKLKELIGQSIVNGSYNGDEWKAELKFSENGSIISFRDFCANGLITNIVKSNGRSENNEINSLIEALNRSFDSILSVKAESKK